MASILRITRPFLRHPLPSPHAPLLRTPFRPQLFSLPHSSFSLREKRVVLSLSKFQHGKPTFSPAIAPIYRKHCPPFSSKAPFAQGNLPQQLPPFDRREGHSSAPSRNDVFLPLLLATAATGILYLLSQGREEEEDFTRKISEKYYEAHVKESAETLRRFLASDPSFEEFSEELEKLSNTTPCLDSYLDAPHFAPFRTKRSSFGFNRRALNEARILSYLLRFKKVREKLISFAISNEPFREKLLNEPTYTTGHPIEIDFDIVLDGQSRWQVESSRLVCSLDGLRGKVIREFVEAFRPQLPPSKQESIAHFLYETGTSKALECTLEYSLKKRYGDEEFVRHNPLDRDHVECILSLGASPSLLLVNGTSFLYEVCELDATQIDPTTQVEIVETLLDQGASPTLPNKRIRIQYDFHPELHNATPIYAAASSGNVRLLQLLIERGAPFDEPNRVGRTPFLIAKLKKREEAALFLEKLGARKNVQDAYGMTPFGRDSNSFEEEDTPLYPTSLDIASAVPSAENIPLALIEMTSFSIAQAAKNASSPEDFLRHLKAKAEEDPSHPIALPKEALELMSAHFLLRADATMPEVTRTLIKAYFKAKADFEKRHPFRTLFFKAMNLFRREKYTNEPPPPQYSFE